MGFGEILELKIKQIPNDLALWLLGAFDADKCCLRIGKTKLGVTSYSVKRVFGLPRGPKSFDQAPRLLKRHLNMVQYGEAIGVLKEARSRVNV